MSEITMTKQVNTHNVKDISFSAYIGSPRVFSARKTEYAKKHARLLMNLVLCAACFTAAFDAITLLHSENNDVNTLFMHVMDMTQLVYRSVITIVMVGIVLILCCYVVTYIIPWLYFQHCVKQGEIEWVYRYPWEPKYNVILSTETDKLIISYVNPSESTAHYSKVVCTYSKEQISRIERIATSAFVIIGRPHISVFYADGTSVQKKSILPRKSLWLWPDEKEIEPISEIFDRFFASEDEKGELL